MLKSPSSKWNVETLAKYGYLLTERDYDIAYDNLSEVDQMYLGNISDLYEWPRQWRDQPSTLCDLSSVYPTAHDRF